MTHFTAIEATEKLRFGLTYRKRTLIIATPVKGYFTVETAEGVMHGRDGDYLANNVEGTSTPWIIRKEILQQTYEQVK